MYDVVGIDTPCVDLLCHIEKIPEPNESIEIVENSWQGGGKVATGIIAAARLGLKTAIIGNVGNDVYGKYCIDDFKNHDVDVKNLQIEEDKSTTLCVVLSDGKTNGRNILYKRGNTSFPKITSSDYQMISNSRYLHIAGWKSIHITAAKYAKEQGTITVLDADDYSPGLDEILPYIDILIASEFVYKHFFKDDCYMENLKLLHLKGPTTVIFTLGGDGCVGVCEDTFFRIPAFKIRVRDTVGAGDVFHGAYIFGLCQNWDAENCAEFASAVSAIKCTRIGGRAGIPTAAMTQEFIKTGVIDEKQLDQRVKYYERGIENVR
jgi:sugar/nucleoside kinase (ribokinase family)